MNKPDNWPDGYECISSELYIIEDGDRIKVAPEDLRLIEVKEIMVVESYRRKIKVD